MLAAVLIYGRGFSAPFVFDDLSAVVNNPTIRSAATAFAPPSNGSGVSGRPMVNLSLALNYATGGTGVRGYHVLNILIHLAAGLTLFGIVRRTIASGAPSLRSLPPVSSAFAVALLWTVHPLQTETVQCVVQRTESLMGLLLLLTLYFTIRGASSPRPAGWFAAAVAACLAGMAAKEVMIVAPLLVLLYDRTFLAGSFRGAWSRRRGLYLGLAATAVLLALLAGSGMRRGHAAGFGLGVSAWDYALTQCKAIALYLRLSVWPHPLVVDYGTALVKNPLAVAPQAALLVLLVAGTAVALRHRPVLGFAGAWFFAILAPSSSVIPLASQTIAEHRMYLPLAAVVSLATLAFLAATGRRGLPVLLALAAVLAWVSSSRITVFSSELSLWSDTVAKCPDNVRARNNLGNALLLGGRADEAFVHYSAAERLDPVAPEAHLNLANTYVQLNRPAEALPHCEAALRVEPDSADAHFNLGNALLHLNRPAEAAVQFETVLKLQPGEPETLVALGDALLKSGRAAGAAASYAEALRLRPGNAEACFGLGNALAETGDTAEAARAYAQALQLNPGHVEAHCARGNLLAQGGDLAAAIEEYRTVLRLAPDHLMARNNLGNAFLVTGRIDEAIAEYRHLLRLHPDDAEVRQNLEIALRAKSGRSPVIPMPQLLR